MREIQCLLCVIQKADRLNKKKHTNHKSKWQHNKYVINKEMPAKQSRIASDTILSGIVRLDTNTISFQMDSRL